MEKVNFVLPNFYDIIDKKNKNPLELFIYNNEPAGNDEIQFNKELEEAIKYIISIYG